MGHLEDIGKEFDMTIKDLKKDWKELKRDLSPMTKWFKRRLEEMK